MFERQQSGLDGAPLHQKNIIHPQAINKVANPLDDILFIKNSDQFQNPYNLSEVYHRAIATGQIFSMGSQYSNYIT
jgi:hypothetical protein